MTSQKSGKRVYERERRRESETTHRAHSRSVDVGDAISGNNARRSMREGSRRPCCCSVAPSCFVSVSKKPCYHHAHLSFILELDAKAIARRARSRQGKGSLWGGGVESFILIQRGVCRSANLGPSIISTQWRQRMKLEEAKCDSPASSRAFPGLRHPKVRSRTPPLECLRSPPRLEREAGGEVTTVREFEALMARAPEAATALGRAAGTENGWARS